MACGLPVIVTGRGPALDYCTRDTAYLVPAEERPVPGPWDRGVPTVRDPTWFDPDKPELCRLLRGVFESRDDARRVGARASARILERFTWRQSADAIAARLRA